MEASTNGLVGSCSSGADAQDAVQCVLSSTPVSQACAANEWFVGSMTPTFSASNASAYDTGNHQNVLHPFRSDISLDASRIVYLGSAGATEAVRQTVAKVVDAGTGNVLSYVYPRVAFFNRLDVSGSQKNASLYPTAALLIWNATDVMFSHDASYIYLFFSYTYDFIARCKVLAGESMMMQPSDCSQLSVATISTSTSMVTFKGCTHLRGLSAGPYMACIYDLEATQTALHLVGESDGSKVVIDSSSVSASVRRPRSPPAWNAANLTLYYICDTNGGLEHAVRYVTLNASTLRPRSSGFLYQGGAGASPEYHSFALSSNNQLLVASDKSKLVTFSSYNSQPFSAKTEREVYASSGGIKDMAIRYSTTYLLVHGMKSWAMYTHCAPCPANSFSAAGSSLSGSSNINVCKCNQDYYGLIARPVLDTCMRCVNYGSNLLLNQCPSGTYKTNIRCAADSKSDSTCAACRAQCRVGMNGSDPGQYIARQCDGTGTSPDVACVDCTRQCPSDDQYMDPSVVCTGMDAYDTRPSQACKPCRTSCGMGRY